MNTQTLTSEVVFRQPFALSGLGIQPAGTYTIETYSELLDIPTAVAYRRLSTSIELHAQPAGIIRRATIDPAELEEALRLEAASESLPGSRTHAGEIWYASINARGISSCIAHAGQTDCERK
jgi:hypothetical protein